MWSPALAIAPFTFGMLGQVIFIVGLFKGQTYVVLSIAFLPDGTHVVSGS